VAVEVHGVGVVGAVAEGESVALARVEEELVVVGVGLAVDEEEVEFAGAAGDFLDCKVELLNVFGGRGLR